MTTTTHNIPAAPAPIELISIIERGPAVDNGRVESVNTMRGALMGLAFAVPFWAAVFGAVAFLAH
ncbi:hypothetical protein [Pseudoclavibacter sp. VKM Ac-2867]|uniref:hypothetical protein n=1 Tax=Pseudoclavibacter sp. VKM Ac-2867 TaxID=2783829 RepID=UPI00188B0E60|nr:hypothetical protein [Pseudoclavibacter sp. VKM Ac-2867]MBF4459378.1 hypothetical protein [Pseudoclavibacter sp. VKM Ac-2867]